MVKKIFKSELKTICIVMVLFWIVAFSLFAAYSGMLISTQQFEATENSALYRLKDIDSTFYHNISDINTFAELISTDEQKFIDIIKSQDSSNELSTLANKLINDNTYINGFALISQENRYVTYNMPNITSDNIIHLQVAFPLADKKPGELKWFFSESGTTSLFTEYIICGLNVFETDKSKLYIFLDKSILNGIIQTDSKTSIITLMDQNGKIFTSSDNDAFNQMLYAISGDVINLYNTESGFIRFNYNADPYICIHHQSRYTGFKYVEFKKMTAFYESSRRLIVIIIILTLLFISATIIMYSVLKNRLIKPITDLSDEMKLFNQNSLNKKIQISGSSEINIIIRSFNILIDRVNSIIADIRTHEEQKKTIELNALKSQIRPHFLYNTLNSIRIISLNNKQYDIAKSIQILSKLLKNTVSSYETYTPLEKEIESIKNYIELMQICYNNRININYDIEPHTHQYMVPSIILQPIIENAIGHGLSKKLCQPNLNATLFISAKELDEKLCICVTDNGIGMTKEQIDGCLLSPIDNSGNSIGLKNLVNRIKLLYKDTGSVTIDSELDKFTTVTITIPI